MMQKLLVTFCAALAALACDDPTVTPEARLGPIAADRFANKNGPSPSTSARWSTRMPST
jgi:hypothetical protein